MARRLRFLLATATSCALLGLEAPSATASPPMPRPLERKVIDADAVVLAKPRTRPEHSGDTFDVDVEECFKGNATGTLRVTAAYYFQGCCPPPGGWPDAEALEKDATRLVLFLDPAKDGVRSSRDPVVLAEASTTSAWFYDDRPAALAPDAVRALAALDREEDVARAVELWAAGLEGDNALLVTALLHRADFVAGGGDYATSVLGAAAAAKAREQWVAGRGRLLEAVARSAESRDRHLRLFAFRIAASTEAPPAPITEVETAARARLLAAADAASGGALGDDVVRAALGAVCALGDETAAARIVALLPRMPSGQLFELGRCAAAIAKRYPATMRDFAAAAIAQLPRPSGVERATAFASQLAGRRLESADDVRQWAAAAQR